MSRQQKSRNHSNNNNNDDRPGTSRGGGGGGRRTESDDRHNRNHQNNKSGENDRERDGGGGGGGGEDERNGGDRDEEMMFDEELFEMMEEDEEDDQTPVDNWDLWAKVHSNRDVRLKLLCRDPDERTPPGSNSVVVRKLPLDATKEQISSLFHKAGGIKTIYFPKVAPHFTTKYCFITFHDYRQAERAQKFFDGYQWGRDRLQVVSYDSCYKYRQQLATGSKSSKQPPPEEDQGTSIVFNAVRQAEAQSESRMTKFIKQAMLADAHSPAGHRSGAAGPSSANPEGGDDEEEEEENSGDRILELLAEGLLVPTAPTPSFPPDTAAQLQLQQGATLIGCSSALLAQEAQAALYLFRECDTVDDMLLDSEVGFLNWLEGRLKFAGPIHYTDQLISRALQKTPMVVQTMFTWLLGAFRCLNDSRRFKLVGPFLCLPSHSWCAEDKCIALGFGADDWYKEEWEPVAPQQIQSTKVLIRYLRRMLDRFGPLRADDIKLQQLAMFISPIAFAHWPPPMPSRVDQDDDGGESSSNGDQQPRPSSTSIDRLIAAVTVTNSNTLANLKRLLGGLDRSGYFRLTDGVVYSTQVHYEILLLKATMAAQQNETESQQMVTAH